VERLYASNRGHAMTRSDCNNLKAPTSRHRTTPGEHSFVDIFSQATR